jgi:hypothetical protein
MRVVIKGGIYIRNNYGCLYGHQCQFQQNGPEQPKKAEQVNEAPVQEVPEAQVVKVDCVPVVPVMAGLTQEMMDRIRQAVEYLDAQGLIQYKYSLAAVKQILQEKCAMHLPNNKFVEIIKSCRLKSISHPSEENLKKVVFSHQSKHPDWKISGLKQEKVEELVMLGNCFWEYFSIL